MREFRRAVVEPAVRQPARAADHGVAVGYRVGHPLEEICEIELHAHTVPGTDPTAPVPEPGLLPRYYSPILT